MRPAVAKHVEPVSPSNPVTPLSIVHVGLIRTSFQTLAADRDRLIEMFYARAYVLDPHLRKPQLASNMLAQRMQFMLVLGDMVRQLDDPPLLAQTVTSVARQHGIYGASDSRFRTARAAFAWAVDRILETERHGDLRVAWCAALDLVEALLSGGIPSGG